MSSCFFLLYLHLTWPSLVLVQKEVRSFISSSQKQSYYWLYFVNKIHFNCSSFLFFHSVKVDLCVNLEMAHVIYTNLIKVINALPSWLVLLFLSFIFKKKILIKTLKIRRVFIILKFLRIGSQQKGNHN